MLWKCNPEYEILLKYYSIQQTRAHAMDKEKRSQIRFLLQFKVPKERFSIKLCYLKGTNE